MLFFARWRSDAVCWAPPGSRPLSKEQAAPGFPVKFVALMNFMRLSSMKAAQAAVPWRRERKSGGLARFFARCGIPRSFLLALDESDGFLFDFHAPLRPFF